MVISLTAIALLISVVALFTGPAAAPRPEGSVPLTAEAWLDTFSLRAYRPMVRLASPDDGHYLKSARDSGELKRYRRIQRMLLREYLRSLSRDFHRLHAIAAEKTGRVKSEEGGQSMALFEQQIGFIFQIWSIEARLLVHTVIPHSINLEPLLANVETLAAETRELVKPKLRYRIG